MKINHPLISVVILAGPTRQKDCIRCISSILKSTYQNYEILLVDNSGERSFSINIAKKFPSVRILFMPYNTGIMGFNIGYANARGTYILSIDDDASVAEDTLQNIADYFDSHKGNIGIVGVNSMNPDTGKSYHSSFTDKKITDLFSATVGGYIVTRKALEKAGYYDDTFFMWIHEDDLFLRVRDAHFEVKFSPEIVMYHPDTWRTKRYNMIYYLFRNSMWMFMKNFEWYLIPLLTARLLVTLVLLPIKKKSIMMGLVGIGGIIMSILFCSIPLQKRKPVSVEVQMLYLKYYLFGQFPK